uniref:Uncharacterized protein n=1 Tax=Tetraselmis sp. GSL018 TaxID=582737 RepID=A0A061R3T1_9CHLO
MGKEAELGKGVPDGAAVRCPHGAADTAAKGRHGCRRPQGCSRRGGAARTPGR